MRILVTEGWIQAACWVINLPILLSDFAAAPVRRQGRGVASPLLTVLGCAAFFIQQDGKKKWWKLDHNFSTASAKSCSLGVM